MRSPPRQTRGKHPRRANLLAKKPMKGSGIAVSESAVAEAVVSARGMFGKLVAVKAKPAKPVVLVLPVAELC